MSDDYSKLYGAPETPLDPDDPAAAPKPFTLDSSAVDVPPVPQPAYAYPQQGPAQQTYTPPPQAYAPPPKAYTPPPAPQPVPRREKKPFSPIPLLLIAGVAFLFLGGVLFMTSTWDVMPNTGRAITLLSAGVIAFAANFLAERVFRLQKTGFAFYILGCIFLPLSLSGIGVFRLFGDWFSFDGGGKMLVYTAVCLSVALSTLLGEKRYRITLLAWMSQAGFAGALSFLAYFLASLCAMNGASGGVTRTVACSLLVLFAIGGTIWTEFLKRKQPDSLMGKTVVFVLYPMMALYAGLIWTLMEEMPVAAIVLSLLLAVLFCNLRFAAGQLHLGVLGSGFALFTAAVSVVKIRSLGQEILSGYTAWFIFAAMAVILMVLHISRHPAISRTYGICGLVLGIGVIPFGAIGSCVDAMHLAWLLTMYGLLSVSLLFIGFAKKNRFPTEVLFLGANVSIVFITLLIAANGYNPLLLLLLVIAALVLLAEAFLDKRIWPLMTAGAACAGLLIERLPVLFHQEQNTVCLMLWLFTAGFLTTVIYAHVTGRTLLEKSAAWILLPLIVASAGSTFELWIDDPMPALILVTAIVTLLYLLEAVVFWKHTRTEGTRPYLEMLSVLGCLAAMTAYLATSEIAYGWGFLLLILIGTFAVIFTRKRINVIALPHLLMLFVVACFMIVSLDEERVASFGMAHAGIWGIVFRTAGMALLLGAYALLGRFLVPEGFLSTTDKSFRMDWPLILGILPAIAAPFAADWHPGILFFLFLTVYALLYVGRLQHKRIPALLASLFFCITILMHNWEDPFGLFVLWRNWEVRTPQLLLYLAPLHLFILTLLWILPKYCRSGVHVARFVMYCVTMLCLLLSSMSFGNVADAIILVVFSFLILAGSFFVKRLRWFALGFAVLVVMTVRLTWSFWTSLHWGIYLFLAGAILIGIASVYELKVRRSTEDPESLKKAINPFYAWKW